MHGPIRIVRSDTIKGLQNTGSLYRWVEGKADLYVDAVNFNGQEGCIICYNNPPVHQVGNPALDAYLEAIEILEKEKSRYKFLILYGSNDPVHAGGDLKESLSKLDNAGVLKKELEARGAKAEEIDALYAFADRRLEKGFSVYRGIRRLSKDMRVVSVCGGGMRYGGSAEIPLIGDVLVGDSRSGMCFSEVLIGLIPGWCGIGRAITKAGLLNARYMGATAAEVKAADLKAIGIYNAIVEAPFSFPKKENTGDAEKDNARYQEALQENNDRTGRLLLPKALELATCPAGEIPVVKEEDRKVLVTEEALTKEVARRTDPYTYEKLWGRLLKEAKDDLRTLGRPIAPQSIEQLTGLLSSVKAEGMDEEAFVKAEVEADARLYRDSRLRTGIIATLEQKVADFRKEKIG